MSFSIGLYGPPNDVKRELADLVVSAGICLNKINTDAENVSVSISGHANGNDGTSSHSLTHYMPQPEPASDPEPQDLTSFAQAAETGEGKQNSAEEQPEAPVSNEEVK